MPLNAEKEIEEIARECQKKLNSLLKDDIEVELEVFADSAILNMIVSDEKFTKAEDIVYGSKDWEKFFKETQKKYSSFGYKYICTVRKNVNTKVKPKVGDFVLIDSTYLSGDRRSIGVVTSKISNNGKTKFGCSYIVIDMKKDNPIYMEKEDYGGYHDGFCKVLSSEEAKKLITKQVKIDCEAVKEELEYKKKASQKDIQELFKVLSDPKFKVKKTIDKIDIAGYHPYIDPTILDMDKDPRA